MLDIDLIIAEEIRKQQQKESQLKQIQLEIPRYENVNLTQKSKEEIEQEPKRVIIIEI